MRFIASPLFRESGGSQRASVNWNSLCQGFSWCVWIIVSGPARVTINERQEQRFVWTESPTSGWTCQGHNSHAFGGKPNAYRLYCMKRWAPARPRFHTINLEEFSSRLKATSSVHRGTVWPITTVRLFKDVDDGSHAFGWSTYRVTVYCIGKTDGSARVRPASSGFAQSPRRLDQNEESENSGQVFRLWALSCRRWRRTELLSAVAAATQRNERYEREISGRLSLASHMCCWFFNSNRPVYADGRPWGNARTSARICCRLSRERGALFKCNVAQ